MEDTHYDAYLFQDADDWSAPDRLELLLDGAERTGAELIGTQEMRVFCDEPEAVPIEWPLDVNACFAERPTAFPLLHPTSLVSRDAVMAVGGFATGLRFGGDAEFLRRVHHIARVVNIPAHGYYRRIRRTRSPPPATHRLARPQADHGDDLRAGQSQRRARGERAGARPVAAQDGPPVGFTRLAGPELKPGSAAAPAAPTAEEGRRARSSWSGRPLRRERSRSRSVSIAASP